jgi:hypothetical protein
MVRARRERYTALSMSVWLSRLVDRCVLGVGLSSAPAVALIAVVLSATPAWAATPRSGRYAGFVGGVFSISFRVANTKITHLVTNFEATTCSGLAPAESSPSFGFPTLAIENGHFAGSRTVNYRSGISPHFTLSGSFSTPKRAAGTLHEHIALPPNFGAPSCTVSYAFSVTRIGE